MISATMAFLAGWLLTWPALIGFVVLGILFEHNGARGWSVFTALVLAALAYFFFAVPLSMIGIGAIVYLVVGLLWSFWRYKRHVDITIEKNMKSSDREKEQVLYLLHPRQMAGTITAWILIWPFSLVENLVGDIINAVQAFAQKFFRGVYHRFYNNAVSKLGVK